MVQNQSCSPKDGSPTVRSTASLANRTNKLTCRLLEQSTQLRDGEHREKRTVNPSATLSVGELQRGELDGAWRPYQVRAGNRLKSGMSS